MEKNNFMKKLSSIFKSNLLINKIQKKKKSKEEIKKLKEIKKKIKSSYFRLKILRNPL